MNRPIIALLGSGETAPGMTSVHRQLLAAYPAPVAVNLNTSYGFQENVPQMSAKLEEYFDVSLHQPLASLSLTNFEAASPLERESFRQGVASADYIFSGPGSPTYALAQWRALGLETDLAQALERGATVSFASAAALTLGRYTAPIYEVYKVGSPLYWLDGLDLLGTIGLTCAVIPHFNNNEGSNYDTSCCYLGLRRLEILEAQLPEGVATLGVDEHTALIFNIAADTVQVLGKSDGHWRVNGQDRVLANGSTTPLAELRNFSPAPRAAAPVPTTVSGPDALGEAAAAGDVSALAQLVSLAKTGGTGFIDPTPLVEGILAARLAARAAKQYELADQLRDALVAAGIEVKDGPDGATWSIR